MKTVENIKPFSKSSPHHWKQSQSCRGVLQPPWGVCSLGTVCKRSSQTPSVSQKILFGQSSIVPHPGWGERAQQWKICIKLKIHQDIIFSEVITKRVLHGYLLSQHWRTFVPNEMGEQNVIVHSCNLHHRTFNWTLFWHFTFQPNNSLQVLTNVLYKKKVIYWKRTVNSL